MNKLNQQYFETKEKHRQSVYKSSWIIWVTILTIILVAVYRIAVWQTKNTLTQEVLLDKVDNFRYAINDHKFVSSGSNFEILIKQGLYYEPISKEMPLMVISKDSSGTLLFIKKNIADKNYESLVKQWEEKISETDSTYKFSNISDQSNQEIRKEYASVELYVNGKRYVGEILICQKKKDIYIIQGISIDMYWQQRAAELKEMIASFTIL